jgi:hypothetical protein
LQIVQNIVIPMDTITGAGNRVWDFR